MDLNKMDLNFPKDKLDILLKEYEISSQEYRDVLKEYRSQTNLLNYYITAFTGLLLFLLSAKDGQGFLSTIQIKSEYIYSFLLIFSISLLYYIYSYGIDIIYNLYMVEAKNSVLEQKINGEMKDHSLLIWDSKIVRHFNEDLVYHRGWLNPSILTGVANSIAMLLITSIHIFLAYQLITIDFKYYYAIITLIISSFLLHQFYILHSSGRKYIFDSVHEFNSLKSHIMKTKFNVIYIPIFTFLVGFFAFFIFSLKEDAFWYTSKVDFPLIFIYTMSVGDAILLPLINYKLGDLVLNAFEKEQLIKNKKFFINWSIFLFTISIIFNSISHYAWATDKYTDFMGLIPGQLTIGGWWHLIFSVFEMYLVGIFYIIWFIAIREKNHKAILQAKKLWVWVFLFSTLMIVNFIHQYFFVYNQPLFDALLSAKFTFVPSVLSICMRYYMITKERNMNKEV